MRLLIIIVALALLGLGPSEASIAGPSQSAADNGLIVFEKVFVSGDATNSEIFVIQPDGSNPINLTNSPESEQAPSWAPDGRQIAFARGGSIWVMNADGSGQRSLTDPGWLGNSPAWSPDGSEIAYSAHSELRIIPVSGGPERVPTWGGGPEWSPDGSRLVGGGLVMYSSQTAGSPPIQIGETYHEGFQAYAPAWSPDGQHIAYTSSHNQGYHIWTFEFVKNELRQLTTFGSGDATWSPDGSQIAFVGNEVPDQDLFIMNSDGSNVRRITNDPQRDVSPDWQSMAVPGTLPATGGSAAASQSGSGWLWFILSALFLVTVFAARTLVRQRS